MKKARSTFLVAIMILGFVILAQAQNVGINSTGAEPSSSAMLDVNAANKGLLIPRIALSGTSDVATISSPATSLLIYNTATIGDVTPGYYYYNGSSWIRLTTGLSSQWTTTGSNIYYNTGNVGIGTSTITNKLEVAASESEGITIGQPNDPMGRDGGSYSIKFYGFRDIVPNAISAKITADRTDAGSAWWSQGTSMGFYTSSILGASNADNSIERMRITDNGFVGIGTSAPSTLLDVNGIITATGGNSGNWNTAFSWGNHANLYKPLSYVPGWSDITDKPTFATVSSSGSYNDLLNKPTILNSQWTTTGSNIYFNTGSIGIGTSSPSASAALEVNSTTKGFLPPRMTTTQRDAMIPVAGLQIFNTTTNKPNYFNGIDWVYFDGTVTDTYGAELPIGSDYQGGKVAYILRPWNPGYSPSVTHGLIAAPVDQSNTIIEWYSGVKVTGATATTIGTGEANTNRIVSILGAGSYAAQLCSDLTLGGYSDWYLPSLDELNQLYLNRAQIGGFSNDFYWSSSEIDSWDVWSLNFKSGAQGFTYRGFPIHVRAIRSF